MSKESETTKKVTQLIKAGDKLVQDVQRDVGQVIMAVDGIKAMLGDIRNKFKESDGK
jgi:hypothetical protein